MREFLTKLRLAASTITAVVCATFIVGMGVSGKLGQPNLDAHIKFEANIVTYPNRDEE